MKRIMVCIVLFSCALCATACGKTAEVSDTVSDIPGSNCDEISFSVKYCDPEAVTYTVCSSKKDFLFYEGHKFASIQKYVDGNWYPLVSQPQDSTGDFIKKAGGVNLPAFFAEKMGYKKVTQ